MGTAGDIVAGTIDSKLRLGSAIDGTRDELVIAIQRATGSASENYLASATWKEL